MTSKNSRIRKLLKFIKYTVLFTVFLLFIGVALAYFEGRSIYGGQTEVVDGNQFKPETGAFVIQNVNLLAEDGNSFIENQNIFFDEGRIVAIDSTLQALKVPSGGKMIDGTGKYLIPGLIDAHVHLFESQNDLLLYVANGVTEIREMIGEPDHLKWRSEIENGRIGPKMFVASPRLATFGGIEGYLMESTQGFKNIKNVDQVKKVVKQFYDEGYDGIKIYSQLSKECYDAVNEAAKSLKMPVFGHIPWETTLDDIYKSEQKGIAHFEEIANALRREFKEAYNLSTTFEKKDEFLEFLNERIDDVAYNLIKNEITVTSTLWLTKSFEAQKFELDNVLKEVRLEYQNPGISEWSKHIPDGIGWLPEVNRYKIKEKLNEDELIKERKYWYTYALACEIIGRRLHQKGVKIIAGTDANLPPTVPGFSLHDELGVFKRLNMSHADILKSTTINSAEQLGSNSGIIKVGKNANIVLLDKNPLEDINNTKSIQTVILDGKVFKRELLDAILLAVKKANDKSRKISINEFTESID